VNAGKTNPIVHAFKGDAMKHLDNFPAAFAFGLCTITLATFCMACAGWAYGVLGTYEQELIAIASKPVLSGVVTATASSGSSSDEQRESRIVHLEPLTVVGHRGDAGIDSDQFAREDGVRSRNPGKGRS
jgi:hypothetical protein